METNQNSGTEITEEVTNEALSDIAGGRKPGVYAEYGCTLCKTRAICKYRGNGPIPCKFCGKRSANFIKFVPHA